MTVCPVGVGDWSSNDRVDETTAAVKIRVDSSNDTMVGAHMFGPEYGDLINFCELAIQSSSPPVNSHR